MSEPITIVGEFGEATVERDLPCPDDTFVSVRESKMGTTNLVLNADQRLALARALAPEFAEIADLAGEVVGWLCPGPDCHVAPEDYIDETAVWCEVPDEAFESLQKLYKAVGRYADLVPAQEDV